jgi:hypothetical protein
MGAQHTPGAFLDRLGLYGLPAILDQMHPIALHIGVVSTPS